MARQTLTTITQVSGKGIDQREFVKRANENFIELYAGTTGMTPMAEIADATSEDIVTKFNSLLAAMKTAGLMEE